MTAMSEVRDADRPASLTFPVLAMLLGFVAVYALVVDGLLSLDKFWGPQGWQTSAALAVNLLLVGAIWGLSRSTPSRAKTVAMLALLAFAGVLAIGATAAIVKSMRAHDFAGLSYWKTQGLITANLLVLAGAVWGVWKLGPRQALRGPGEPVSPSTRRTQKLFALSGLLGIPGAIALSIGLGGGELAGVTSGGQVPLGIAVVVMATWLLGNVAAWWWYYSADEHERRANDVGFLLGGGVFLAVTPIWWIASRAGLAPPPDAMLLWLITTVLMTIGWIWYRSR